MKLLTAHDRARRLANGAIRRQVEDDDPGACLDFLPVVKLFTPDAGYAWLLTELDPDDTDRAFGLCDLGLGFPELGHGSLTELASIRGPLNFRSSATSTSRPRSPFRLMPPRPARRAASGPEGRLESAGRGPW